MQSFSANSIPGTGSISVSQFHRQPHHHQQHQPNQGSINVNINQVAPIDSLPIQQQSSDLQPPQQAQKQQTNKERLSAAYAVKLDKAQRYRDNTCPRNKLYNPNTADYTSIPHSICKFTTESFLDYGLGITLYFKFLIKLGICFLLLSILSIPALFLIISSDDSNKSTTGYSLEKSTIGNFASSFNSINTVNSSNNNTNSNSLSILLKFPTATVEINKSTIILILSIADCLICLIFLLFINRLNESQKRSLRDYIQKELTIVHYSVQVTGLAANFTDRLELANFFQSRFGPVVDIALTYSTDHNLLDLYRLRGKTRKDLDIAVGEGETDKLNGLFKLIDDIDKDITQYKSNHTNRILVAAYVVFEHQESRIKCVRAYSRYWLNWLTRNNALNVLSFDNNYLTVVQASEPSNIYFRNLQYTNNQKLFRRFITGFITFLLLCLSMATVFIAHEYQKRLPQEEACLTTISLELAQSSTSTDAIRDCYCKQLGVKALQQSGIDCSGYLANYALVRILSVISVLVIVIVNFILRNVVKRLVDWEKHSSVTNSQQAIANKLFISSFLNTGLILLIVNARFQRYIANFGITIAFDGQYSDFTADWFEVVGLSIMLTMILGIANPHIWPVLCIPIQKCKRSNHCISKSITQADLNNKYSGMKFDLAQRYAIILNTVFVTFMYSAGMPLLMIIAGLTCCMCYWLDKTSFLRVYSIPPRFDAALAEWTIELMPYAILLHLVFALWFLSSPVLTGITVANDSGSTVLDYSILSFQDRLFRWDTAPISILFVLLLLWFIVQYCSIFCDSNKSIANNTGTAVISNFSNLKTFSEASESINLESYHPHKAPLFHDAFIRTPSNRQLPKPITLNKLRELQMKLAIELEAEEQLTGKQFTIDEILARTQKLDLFYSPAIYSDIQSVRMAQLSPELKQKHLETLKHLRQLARNESERNRIRKLLNTNHNQQNTIPPTKGAAFLSALEAAEKVVLANNNDKENSNINYNNNNNNPTINNNNDLFSVNESISHSEAIMATRAALNRRRSSLFTSHLQRPKGFITPIPSNTNTNTISPNNKKLPPLINNNNTNRRKSSIIDHNNNDTDDKSLFPPSILDGDQDFVFAQPEDHMEIQQIIQQQQQQQRRQSQQQQQQQQSQYNNSEPIPNDNTVTIITSNSNNTEEQQQLLMINQSNPINDILILSDSNINEQSPIDTTTFTNNYFDNNTNIELATVNNAGGAAAAGTVDDDDAHYHIEFNPDHHVLVRAQCPSPDCAQLMQLVDTGETHNYQCPFCGALFRM